VYDDNPSNKNTKVIPIITKSNFPKVSMAKSNTGRGGMFSKLNTVKKATNLRTTSHIASMENVDKKPNIFKEIGTKIVTNSKKLNVKVDCI
jgi:glutamate 5-kinase